MCGSAGAPVRRLPLKSFGTPPATDAKLAITGSPQTPFSPRGLPRFTVPSFKRGVGSGGPAGCRRIVPMTPDGSAAGTGAWASRTAVIDISKTIVRARMVKLQFEGEFWRRAYDRFDPFCQFHSRGT